MFFEGWKPLIWSDQFGDLVVVVAMVFFVSMWAIDDRIVRYVCAREGKRYSVFWMFCWYWLWRMFDWSWFKEAKEAGYFKPLAILRAAWMCFVVALFILGLAAIERPGYFKPLAR